MKPNYTDHPDYEEPLGAAKGCMNALMIAALTIAIIIGIVALCSCSVTTRMNYSVNLADHGTILCRDYAIRADTLYLYDAGRDANIRNQVQVSDCKAIGFKEILIVRIK